MLLKVDFKSGQPVHAQLIAQIRTAIASGILRPAEPLPAIADLAAQLRVNRNNVAKAYSELESLGIIELIHGKGYCLKEEHRPIRKAVTRTADTETAKPRVHRSVRQTIARALPEAIAMLMYLGIAAAAAITALRFSSLHSETFTVFATLVIAALTLPLRKAVKSFVYRKIFPKRHRAPLVLQSLKEGNTDLDVLLDRIGAACGEFIGVTPTIIRDGADVAASVNQFPALRASLGPIAIGDDLLTPLFSHDEIIAVLEFKSSPGKRFDSDDWEFLVALGAEFTAAASRLLLRKERAESEYALEIQRGLLPRNIPAVQGFTIAGAWQPAKDASGDYYDVFRLNENEIALIVADVSGKGPSAALLMSNLQATTKAYASSIPTPAELTARVNAAICASITAGKFITFFFAVLNTDRRTLTYCNAGHNPPFIVTHNGDRKQLEAGGTVLGLFPETHYEQASVDLHPGDRLLIFTDGVLEAADSSAREFGEDRLFTAMTANANASAADLRDSIMQAVTRFCHGDFSDDATLLAVVVNAAEKSAAASAV